MVIDKETELFLAFFSKRDSTFPRLWELATLRIHAARTLQGPMITMVSGLSRLSDVWHGTFFNVNRILSRAHLTYSNLTWIFEEYERLQAAGEDETSLLNSLVNFIVATPTNGNTIEHVLPEGQYGFVKVSFGDETETSKFLNITIATSSEDTWAAPVLRVFSYKIKVKESGEVEQVIDTSEKNNSPSLTFLEQLEILVSLRHQLRVG